MIARELLVKLGFDIDEKKIARFSNNIEAIKSKMVNVKSNLSLNVDNSKMNNFAGNLKTIKTEMSSLRDNIREKLHPQINSDALKAYKKDLASLSERQRNDVLKLNALEKNSIKEQIQNDKARYAQLQSVQTKLAATQSQFKAAATAAKSANLTFSRYFTRFAVVGAGSFFLTLRKTLKDVKDFQDGGGKTNSLFSREQLNTTIQFNNSLKKTKATLGELRNGFVISLMPALQEYTDKMNEWLQQNREWIQLKLKNFVESLGSAFKNLTTIISSVFSILNPLVDLIGGWGNVLTGFIGLGILSWVVRLGMFLKTGASAVIFFSGAIKTLTIALLTNPIVLVLTAISAAIALIADEFIVTARGGDSLMNRFVGLKKIGDQFIGTLKNIWAWLIKVKDNMYDFSFGGGAKNMFNGLVDDANNAAQKISDRFTNMFGGKAVKTQFNNSNQQGSEKEWKTQIIKGFNVTTVPHPNKLSGRDNSTTKNINVTNNNKQPISINITAPPGGSEAQNKNMASLMKEEIQKALDLQSIELSAAIGAV
jgi:hypothetical protein